MEHVKGNKCFESLDLSQHLLFYFGAGWCGPCKEAGPKFEELATKYPSDKMKFFKVDMEEEENNDLKTKVATLELQMDIVKQKLGL